MAIFELIGMVYMLNKEATQDRDIPAEQMQSNHSQALKSPKMAFTL